MASFTDLIQQSSSHAWLFIPSAILLGGLHGLEPGHSKTMMAAFIVAIRGTLPQAVLLGLSATISHTLVVWIVALGGMYLWQNLNVEQVEPYFQIASAVIIVAIALWIMRRTWIDQQKAKELGNTGHHPHDHSHVHEADIRQIDTGHGRIAVEIYEKGVPPRWRIRPLKGEAWNPDDVSVSIERPDGTTTSFSFAQHRDFLESKEEIPEPHEFMARINLGHGHHVHSYDLAYLEDHGTDHMHQEMQGLTVATDGYQDAHELAHANDIRHRFADRNVTNGQIIVFGLTGGLIPCPAAVTVLLLCLQLREFSLGFTLALCFSIGLALTLVAVGAAAALSVRHASQRWNWFSSFARRAPYFSSILIILVGIYTGVNGWLGLSL